MSTLTFPVVIVKKMPKATVLGRYYERAKPRRIELSPALIAYDKKLRMFIMLHEIGHWFRFEHVPKEMVKQYRTKFDREENFAHAFANYFLAPAKLKKDEPIEYEMIAAMVKDHHDDIMSFAERGLRVLESEMAKATVKAA